MQPDHAAAKNQAALASVLAALALTALKLAVGLYTNSLGILSEALHSGLDLLAAIMTFYAVRISSRPADSGHPYGHGKVENLSALAETLLLFIICFWVVYEGVDRLLHGGEPVIPSLWGAAVMAISMIVDINRVRMLRRVARETKSQALEADALHFATDILSSAVVLVGVLAVWLAAALNIPGPVHAALVQADTVAALIVACIIFRSSLHMAREAINTLIDSGATEEQRAIAEAVAAVPGITAVSRVRVRTSGPQAFVDMTVGVDPQVRVSEGHRLAHEAELAVSTLLPGADVSVHVEPMLASAAASNPFVAVQAAAAAHGLAVHDVQVFRTDQETRIELHVEMDGNMPFAQAHLLVRDFEEQVRRQCHVREVLTHLEPREATSACRGLTASAPQAQAAWAQIQQAVEREPLLRAAHGFSAYATAEQGLCVGFHCQVARDLSVEQAHSLSVRLERQLRELIPSIGRICIHLEPEENA